MPPRKRAPSSRRSAASTNDGSTGNGADAAPRQRNPDADPVRIHREYVQRRLGGGALPTPEAYERALDQWHQLPGAVRGPANEVHPAAEQRREQRQVEEEFDAHATAPEHYDGPLPATDQGDNSPYEGSGG